MCKKILHVDLDNTVVDFLSGLDHFSAEVIEAHEGRFDEIEGIFGKMVPLEGAIEALEKLDASGEYDIYILSTAPWGNPSAWSDKLKWVQTYLPTIGYKKLTLSHNKNLLIGDYLIDDRTANGAGEFEGNHLHIFTDKFPNWESVLEELL